MRAFVGATTVAVLGAVGAANLLLHGSSSGAFVTGRGQQGQQYPSGRHAQAPHASGRGLAADDFIVRPVAAAREALGMKGLLAFGMGFGVLSALVRQAGKGQRVAMRAEGGEIAVAEKTETKPAMWLETLPRTIIKKETLDLLMTTVPREQWENPPEDSYLYTLKLYAETYGEGKATKMGWWDYWYLRMGTVVEGGFYSGEEIAVAEAAFRELSLKGQIPVSLPGPAGPFVTGAVAQWRGKEPFAGDQCQTIVTNGKFATQFLDNMAFYREGLKPWQRGLEIGIAHGYFVIGPFVSLGPLRNTPEAATVGLLAGCATIGMVSLGGLLFGATIKPTRFDKEGDLPATGFQEMINWHAIGGLGGAGFAHALITVFGS